MSNPVYQAEWEEKFEFLGPIKETVHPDSHVCIAAGRSAPPPDDCIIPSEVSGGGLFYIWELVEKVLINKKKIIDMGGGPEGRTLSTFLNWSFEAGNHDMRDVSELINKGEKFDLVLSSHSLEHVPSNDVPRMLIDWIKLLSDNGEMFISCPHRCSSCWSILCNTSVGDPGLDARGANHLWAPTAACVGNFLISQGMVFIGYDDHLCRENCWWVHLKKPAR